MKNKKILILIGVVILLITAVTIYWGTTRVSKDGDSVIIKEDKLVTEKLTYLDGEVKYEIEKNRLTKNASVVITFPIPDDTETTELFGENITMVPFTVNLTCSMMNAAVFDPEKFDEIAKELNDGESTDQPITEDPGFTEKLGDYTITEFKIVFEDQEEKEAIATCLSKGKNLTEMQFETFRDYSGMSSLFGAEIGVFEEQNSSPDGL